MKCKNEIARIIVITVLAATPITAFFIGKASGNTTIIQPNKFDYLNVASVIETEVKESGEVYIYTSSGDYYVFNESDNVNK